MVVVVLFNLYVGHFISREANVVLKIYKTLIRPHLDYWNVISRLEIIQKGVTKIISKRLHLIFFNNSKKV